MSLSRSLLLVASLVLSACVAAPQLAVPLRPQAIGASTGRVGVVMTKLPKVNTYFPGAACLLCLAAAELMNTSLTSYTQTLPYEDLPKLKDQAAATLKSKGAKAKVIAEPIDISALPSSSLAGVNVARKDFRSLKSTMQVDKLLVIDITALGMLRTYASYIPTSDPKAVLEGTAYLVDLATNTYEWYAPLNIARASTGAWDEAPSFPGLTNAYFQVLEVGKDSVLKPIAEAAKAPAPATAALKSAP